MIGVQLRTGKIIKKTGRMVDKNRLLFLMKQERLAKYLLVLARIHYLLSSVNWGSN